MIIKKKTLYLILTSLFLPLLVGIILKIIPDTPKFHQEIIGDDNIQNVGDNNIIGNNNIINVYQIGKYENFEIKPSNDSIKLDNNCISNVTPYYFLRRGQNIVGDLIDGCDKKIVNRGQEINSKEGTIIFWVMPLWNRNTTEIHYLLDIGETNKNRISLFVNDYYYLIFRIIDDKGNVYESPLSVNFWDNYEWGFVGITWSQEEINLYFGADDLNGLARSVLPVKNVKLNTTYFKDIFFGSDINGKNQADAVFSKI